METGGGQFRQGTAASLPGGSMGGKRARNPGRAHGRGLGRPKGRSCAWHNSAGFTFIELMVGMTLFAGIALFLLQAFLDGMTYANRADEKAAATSIAMQAMGQIKAR